MVRWLPHDLGTWGFILSLAALLLAVPMSIVAALLTPKVRLWWFLRDVHGTANKLVSLAKYREQLEKEPQFTPTETYIFEAQVRMLVALHFLAYTIVLAVVVLSMKWHHNMTFDEILDEYTLKVVPATPFVLGIFASAFYCYESYRRLRRSSPKEREELERKIATLITKLRSKMPPQNN